MNCQPISWRWTNTTYNQHSTRKILWSDRLIFWVMRSQVQFRQTPKIRSVTLQGAKCGLEACADGEVGSSITPLTQIGKKSDRASF
jgi:hypothetical protein